MGNEDIWSEDDEVKEKKQEICFLIIFPLCEEAERKIPQLPVGNEDIWSEDDEAEGKKNKK